MSYVGMSDREVGQHFYETYCHHAEWKNYQGKPCPRWDQSAKAGDLDAVLTEAVRSHWVAVATRARVGFLGLK